MPADGPAKLAPVRAARAVDAVRRRLRRVEQTLVPPPTAVLDLMSGAFVARAINTAAILGIPYVLSDGPLTAGVIGAGSAPIPMRCADCSGCWPGVRFSPQRADGRFGLTPLADPLRTDAPGSVRGLVLFWGRPQHWGNLPYSLQTGQPSVDALRGKPVFDWLDDNPEFATVFNDGMTSVSDMEFEPVLAAYDFCAFGTVVDVGGGHGRLLAAILRKTAQSRGILVDMDPVVVGAPAVLEAEGVADRCTVLGVVFRIGTAGWGCVCAQAHRARLG